MQLHVHVCTTCTGTAVLPVVPKPSKFSDLVRSGTVRPSLHEEASRYPSVYIL
eukprot:SAG11_NODE_3607_length_2343_cov_2.335561_1_plen_53_part_00